MGCCLWDRTESDTTEVTLAAGKIYREMYNLPKKKIFFKRSEKGVGSEVSSPQSSC